jgi:hypothetical protein
LAADPAFQQAIQVNPTQTDAPAPSADADQLKKILEPATSNPPTASKHKQ